MNVLEYKEFDDDYYYKKIYTLHDAININSLMTIIKEFEGDKYSLSTCHCNSYDEDGSPLYRRYYDVDGIVEFVTSAVNPYVSFSIDFEDKLTKQYAFSLATNTNSNLLSYIVDKKKLTGVQQRTPTRH